MKKEKPVKIIIKGEKYSDDSKGLFMLQKIHLLKLIYIFDDYKRIRKIKSPSFQVKEIKGELLFGTSKEGENWMRKQVYGETILFQSISLIQKLCRDWFLLGLIYSKNGLKHFKNKEIKIGEIIGSKNAKLTIAESIIKKINFNDVEEIHKNFEKIFSIKLFRKEKDRKKITQIMKHRHIIGHNAGLTDKKFLFGKKYTLEEINLYPNISLKNLEFLINFIDDRISEISKKMKHLCEK